MGFHSAPRPGEGCPPLRPPASATSAFPTSQGPDPHVLQNCGNGDSGGDAAACRGATAAEEAGLPVGSRPPPRRRSTQLALAAAPAAPTRTGTQLVTEGRSPRTHAAAHRDASAPGFTDASKLSGFLILSTHLLFFLPSTSILYLDWLFLLQRVLPHLRKRGNCKIYNNIFFVLVWFVPPHTLTSRTPFKIVHAVLLKVRSAHLKFGAFRQRQHHCRAQNHCPKPTSVKSVLAECVDPSGCLCR